MEAEQVLAFWFAELRPEQWFRRDPEVDAAIRRRFADLYARTAEQGGGRWMEAPRSALAAVLVLDQFPRNLFRDDPRAYTTDPLALDLAERAVAQGFDRELDPPEQRAFLYMPLQHSEDPGKQARSVDLFATLGDGEFLDFARRHKAVIDRFGRFPHRNAVLGRASTPAEEEFLRQPGSAF
ncbi:DUF924 family protein [Thiohalorhabdus methylotrophus]|uniref:DUF924 family protein n=1 Tax=Thiohalorhabdus methylotrophus TaxID=3242694 RepID=A0ABV4TU07_9GAMM